MALESSNLSKDDALLFLLATALPSLSAIDDAWIAIDYLLLGQSEQKDDRYRQMVDHNDSRRKRISRLVGYASRISRPEDILRGGYYRILWKIRSSGTFGSVDCKKLTYSNVCDSFDRLMKFTAKRLSINYLFQWLIERDFSR